MGSRKAAGPLSHPRLAAVLYAMFALGSSGACALQTVDTVPPRALLEARQLLQGADDRPFLDPVEIAQVAEALTRVRAAIPEVRDIAHYGDESYLWVSLAESGRSQADTVPELEHTVLQSVTRSRVGVRSIDSLNAVLGADSSTVLFVGTRATRIRPHFREPPNVPVLATLYTKLEEVRHAGPEGYAGGGGEIYLTRTGPDWYFTFVRTWGDCLSGCTEGEYFYVHYSPASQRARRVDHVPGLPGGS